MGSITDFNLRKIRQYYSIDNFVETGTHNGDALMYAIECDYENLYSVDIDVNFFNKSSERFKRYKNVNLFLGISFDNLPDMCQGLVGNTLFWLDAHYPDMYKDDDGDVIFDETTFPLKKEIEVLKSIRDLSNDVIMIDDLRIYEYAPFRGGNWRHLSKKYEKSNITANLEDVYESLYLTHNLIKDYRSTGYLIFVPKDMKIEIY